MAKTFKDDLEAVHKADINKLCELLDIKTVAGKEYVVYVLANSLLMDRKQQDYGPKNIAGFGTFGVLVRMNDKFERLKTLFGKGKVRKRARNESVEDSLRDLANYAVIALLLERGEWPNE
jgi:hypothetical protein